MRCVHWNLPVLAFNHEDFREFPPGNAKVSYHFRGFLHIFLAFPHQSQALTIKIFDSPEPDFPAVNPVNARGIQQHTPVVRFTPHEN